MEYWINVGFMPVEFLVPVARAAEVCGFDGLTLADHLFFPEQMASPYPYSATGATVWPAGTNWPDAWVAMAAMAAATERIRFNTGVYVAPLRDPFSLAKAIGTASVISGGRVMCGFGTGWLREEFDVVGIDFASRGSRFDEMLDVLRLLWSGEMVEYSGTHFRFPPLQMCPPAKNVPILIGGNTAVAMRRAARYDGWIGAHTTMAKSAEVVAEVRSVVAATGVDRPFSISMTGPRVARDRGDLDALGVDAILVPLATLGPVATLAECLSTLESFAEAKR